MSNKADNVIAALREAIEERVREQLFRHSKIDPTGDPKKIIDIQMKQEREKLERLIESNEDNPAMVDALEALIEWLPELSQQIKNR
jgi:hypothetical protein